MVAVLMRDEDGVQFQRVHPRAAQAFFDPSGGYSGVDEKLPPAEFNKDRIASTAAG